MYLWVDKKEAKMTSKFLTWVTGYMGVLFIEKGKTGKRSGFGVGGGSSGNRC